MIMPDIGELCGELKKLGYHITIETAATVFEQVHLDLASLSPKLANSTPHDREGGRFSKAHEAHRLNIPVIQRFIDSSPDFQLKFVVSHERDVDEIDLILAGLKNWEPADVLLMPEGIDTNTLADRSGWIIGLCRVKGFRYCPRLHIALFGNRRGT